MYYTGLLHNVYSKPFARGILGGDARGRCGGGGDRVID